MIRIHHQGRRKENTGLNFIVGYKLVFMVGGISRTR